MLEFEEKNSAGARIKVVGVGGAGGNAINTMIDSQLEGVTFVAANTDLQALKANSAEFKVPMGNNLTRGLGAGANPEVGRNAALEDRERLVEVLGDAEMVFVTAGMGGGTGTGAAPVVARIARELGALTVAVVTKPFHFEGKKRRRQAEEGINELREAVDTLITIPNQRLLNIANQTTTMLDMFKKADEVLFHAVRGISDLITVHGLINLDFADVRTIMAGRGMALMGTGEGSGENRAIAAAKQAISSPLLEEINLKGATGVLINITSGPSLTLFEVNEASTIIQEEAHEEANIIFGAVIDETMEETVRVTVIATGFESRSSKSEMSVPTQQIPYPTISAPVMSTHVAQPYPSAITLGSKVKTLAQPLEPTDTPNKMGALALEKTRAHELKLERIERHAVLPQREPHAVEAKMPPLGATIEDKMLNSENYSGKGHSQQGLWGRLRNLRSGSGAGASRADQMQGSRLDKVENYNDRPKNFEDIEFPNFREEEYDIPTFLRKQAD